MPPADADDATTEALIEDALGQVEAARAQLDRAIGAARTRGWSWAQVAETLGVSRQAAWERFHGKIDQLERASDTPDA